MSTPNPILQTNSMLSCVSPSMCNDIFGTSYEHVIIYGNQMDCKSDDMVRCIDVANINTSTSQSKEPKNTPYQSVQIIGPKPIYLSLNQMEGPKVSNHFGSDGSHLSKQYESKKTEKVERQNRFFLQGVSLDELFKMNGGPFNRRSDQDRTRAKKEAPSHQVLDKVVNTGNKGLPISGDRLIHVTRNQKHNTSHETGKFSDLFDQGHQEKLVSYKKDSEKNKRYYLNTNSLEHLFFIDGGKIRVPYDQNEDNNNYLFFSPKRKLLRKE